jgi:hypothetical protein
MLGADHMPMKPDTTYLPVPDIRARYAELVCFQDAGELSYSDMRQMENIEQVFPIWTTHAKKLWGLHVKAA